MSLQASRLLSFITLCILSALLLTFCGGKDNITKEDNSDTTTPSSTPTPSQHPGPQNGTNKPKHRFTPAEITVGLPFGFHLTWEGKPYLLSLDSCGDALLLHGQWPKTQVTTYIEGTDSQDLDNLVIINTNGEPKIPGDCQLKVTVGQGTADEKSTLIALKVKDGEITISGASIAGNSITLAGVEGVDNNKPSVALIGREVMDKGVCEIYTFRHII